MNDIFKRVGIKPLKTNNNRKAFKESYFDIAVKYKNSTISMENTNLKNSINEIITFKSGNGEGFKESLKEGWETFVEKTKKLWHDFVDGFMALINKIFRFRINKKLDTIEEKAKKEMISSGPVPPDNPPSGNGSLARKKIEPYKVGGVIGRKTYYYSVHPLVLKLIDSGSFAKGTLIENNTDDYMFTAEMCEHAMRRIELSLTDIFGKKLYRSSDNLDMMSTVLNIKDLNHELDMYRTNLKDVKEKIEDIKKESKPVTISIKTNNEKKYMKTLSSVIIPRMRNLVKKVEQRMDNVSTILKNNQKEIDSYMKGNTLTNMFKSPEKKDLLIKYVKAMEAIKSEVLTSAKDLSSHIYYLISLLDFNIVWEKEDKILKQYNSSTNKNLKSSNF